MTIGNKEFVQKCGELLALASPHLIGCAYAETEHEETVTVTCANGHEYKIDVTGNSLCATAHQIFEQMRYK